MRFTTTSIIGGLILLPRLVPAAALPPPASLSSRSTTLVNSILGAITSVFPASIAVSDVSNTITVGEQTLAAGLGVSTTANFGSGCSDMMVVFARGTTEAGNVGLLTGPPFFDALKSTLGSGVSVDVQGINYPASIAGFLAGGDAAGSTLMASTISQTLQKCPSSKVVMAGYSQGGQLVHNAASQLPAATMAQVSSVVIFGDPDDGEAVAGASAAKTLVVCHTGDNICQHGDLILVPHLTYSDAANTAAAFVAGNM